MSPTMTLFGKEMETILAIVWYSTVTVYVAYKGAHDIRNMLRDLRSGHEERKTGK
jgi:hypothetical protein